MLPRGNEKRDSGVATESTNTNTKTGSGRIVFYVLIALAAVLFILGLTDEYTQDGPNIHPMDQFLIEPLFGHGPIHWYTPTNVTLWMGLAIAAIIALMVMGTKGRAVIPSRSQSMAELAYGFVRKMVEDVAGKDALPYFPYIFTLFLFILVSNFLGLIPSSFTTTSHIAVTAVLAMGVFIGVTVLGFVKNGASFLSLFWVSSAPLALRPILAVIELISYFVRPVSHSIRLAGNVMAGHAVLKVFAGFAGALGAAGIVPILGVVAIYGLEVLVSAIQAYVFTILTCVYLKDALHPHH
jgi:F-type H+-transporting ATPase subunit a